jgi:hypothetical protein
LILDCVFDEGLLARERGEEGGEGEGGGESKFVTAENEKKKIK